MFPTFAGRICDSLSTCTQVRRQLCVLDCSKNMASAIPPRTKEGDSAMQRGVFQMSQPAAATNVYFILMKSMSTSLARAFTAVGGGAPLLRSRHPLIPPSNKQNRTSRSGDLFAEQIQKPLPIQKSATQRSKKRKGLVLVPLRFQQRPGEALSPERGAKNCISLPL